jgi:hypothetical protein
MLNNLSNSVVINRQLTYNTGNKPIETPSLKPGGGGGEPGEISNVNNVKNLSKAISQSIDVYA